MSVAVEVARALNAELTVMPVEEIATPGKPEYVVGAVAENAIHVIDAEALAALGVTEDSLAVRVAEATAKIAKESKLYRGEGASTVEVAARPIVVVDDGSATIPALEVVAMALARHKVDSIFLLTPTPPGEDLQGYCRVITVERTPEQADDVALIGAWYDDPAAPDDAAAAAILHAYNADRSS